MSERYRDEDEVLFTNKKHSHPLQTSDKLLVRGSAPNTARDRDSTLNNVKSSMIIREQS
jgi:hypothetical protein